MKIVSLPIIFFVSISFVSPCVLMAEPENKSAAEHAIPDSDKKTVDTALSQGIKLMEEGKFDDAIEEFRSIYAHQEKLRLLCNSKIAFCYIAKHNIKMAKEYFLKIAERSKQVNESNFYIFESAYYYLAAIEKQNHRVDNYENYLKEADRILFFIIKNYPNGKAADEANYRMIQHCILRNDLVAAKAYALKVSKGQYRPADGLITLGLLAEEEKDFKIAKDYYSKVTLLYPETHASSLANEYYHNLELGKSNAEENKKIALESSKHFNLVEKNSGDT